MVESLYLHVVRCIFNQVHFRYHTLRLKLLELGTVSYGKGFSKKLACCLIHTRQVLLRLGQRFEEHPHLGSLFAEFLTRTRRIK
jgi:hypothetical protein